MQRLAEDLDNQQLPADLVWFKSAIEDAKAYYLEALTAQPGDYDQDALYQTLWHDTQFGAGLRWFYDQFAADDKLSGFAVIVLPREALEELGEEPIRDPKMRINPITDHFVADVEGVDIGAISDEDFEAVYQAWLTFGVLRLHNQPLDEESLQRFSSRFGPLEERPMGRLSAEARAKVKNRYVTQLSNIVENGKPIGGLGNSEAPGIRI